MTLHSDPRLETLLRSTLSATTSPSSPFLAAKIKGFSRLPQQTAWSWSASSAPALFARWVRGLAAAAVMCSLLMGVWEGSSVTLPQPKTLLQNQAQFDDADIPGLSSTPFTSLEESY